MQDEFINHVIINQIQKKHSLETLELAILEIGIK